MKRFKSRKPRKHSRIIWYIFLIVFGIFIYNFKISLSSDNKINFNNKDILNNLLKVNNASISSNTNFLGNIIKIFNIADINNPISLLTNTYPKKENTKFVSMITESSEPDETYDIEALSKISEHIKDPNPINSNEPLVYIYNSHQLENYDDANMEIYNITPNVMMASYLLKEKLNKLGISTIVEDTNITELMKLNGWNHNGSYKASRITLLAAKNKYDSLQYFIDIHRDSVNEKHTKKTINGKEYARTLFLVGLDNPTYHGNLLLMTELNKIIDQEYPGLSRGILKKKGAGVNGVYNQDVSSGTILIEVGGVDNNIEEVINTTDALANILASYIKDNKE